MPTDLSTNRTYTTRHRQYNCCNKNNGKKTHVLSNTQTDISLQFGSDNIIVLNSGRIELKVILSGDINKNVSIDFINMDTTGSQNVEITFVYNAKEKTTVIPMNVNTHYNLFYYEDNIHYIVNTLEDVTFPG